MNTVDPKSNNRAVSGELVDYMQSVPMAGEQDSSHDAFADLLRAVLHRWYIVLFCAIVIGGGGAAGIWFLVPNNFQTRGVVVISPVVNPIMYQTAVQNVGQYDTFKNTQAGIITGDLILNRVADAVKDSNLSFFKPGENILQKLREMVADQIIEVVPDRRTEFIFVQMTSMAPRDAEKLINAFLSSYEAVFKTDEASAIDDRLSRLEVQRRTLEEEIRRQKNRIRERVAEYGTEQLTPRQEIALQHVATLQKELVSVGVQRMLLEAKLAVRQDQAQDQIAIADVADQIQSRALADPILVSLQQDIQRYEQLVRDAQMTMLDTNPELQRRKQVLQDLYANFEAKKKEVVQRYEQVVLADARRARLAEIEKLQADLTQLKAYEEKLNEQIKVHDQSSVQLGRTQLDIDDLQEELQRMRQIYTEISRRIEELKIERDRQPRISISSWASSVSNEAKKRKMAAAAGFGGVGLGLAIALLLAKLDTRVHQPEEVTRRIGVRIIGTTTSPEFTHKKLLSQQLHDDYQTIRANLGLMDGDGKHRLIVISSPGMGDGKSTLTINLATSFARAGKRTLLVDGDLRKPDIATMLGLSPALRGLQDYLFGVDLQKALYYIENINLYLLAADARNSRDALELLSLPETPKRIAALRDEFEYVLIDTPPVLAFADTMLWSKMADGVILTSFIGHTSKNEMKEAIQRLNDIKANIIGTVVNNVPSSQSYRRYGYGYGYHYGDGVSAQKAKIHKKRGKALLLTALPNSPTDPSGK